MSQQRNAPLGAGLIVVSSFFYASYGVWTKLMGNFFDGYVATVERSIVVLLILVAAAGVAGGLEPIAWRRNWRLLGGMFVASLFVWGPLYYAILHAGVGISATVNYACIVVGMFFFGRLFAREKITRDKWLSALMGLAGLMMVFSPSGHRSGWVALFGAAMSGLCVAANGVFAKQISYKSAQSTIALWAAAGAANAFMALILHKHWPAVSWHAPWLYLLLFAGASVAASWSFVHGVKLVQAGAAGILGLLEIVFGVLFGVIFFHERLSLVVVLGIVTIIAAVALPYLRDYNAQRGTLDEPQPSE